MTDIQTTMVVGEGTKTPCSQRDPELWYPARSLYRPEEDAQRAADLCAGCPLLFECLAHALDNREEHGIWGGMTAEDRADLLRQRTGGRLSGRPEGGVAA